jgi:hypothetical protein
MTRRWTTSAAALLLPSLLIFLFFACGGPTFIGAAEQDGGTNDAAPPPSADAGTGDADAGPPALDSGAGRVVYVSADAGSDLNDGLSPSSPKKSLVSAIAAAGAIDGGAEVHACAGTYLESNLVLSVAVSLRGAYSCATWTRTPTFGYPKFDGKYVTLVENGNPASQPQTLVINESVPSTSIVDGLAVAGAATLAGTTTGLTVRDTAAPLVTDDVISGGAGHPTPTGSGSIGVSILGAASAEVRNSVINGGTGTGSLGSIGVQINSTGTPNVHDNVISGGLGVSTEVVASWGMEIESSAVIPHAIANNIVLGCDSPGVSASAAGIRVAAPDASVDIVGSQIDGCGGTGDGGSNFGIQVNSPGATVRVLEDRVYGGARAGEGAFVAGIDVEAAGTFELHNSMVHAGDVTAASSAANGVELGAVAGAAIVYDTIYAGANNGSAIVLLTTESNATITDSILLGGGPALPHFAAVFAQSCAGALSSLDHTLFANFGGDLYACDQTDGGPASLAATVAGLEALLDPTVAPGDLVFAQQSTCDDDAGCVLSAACPGAPTACLGSLFGASWTSDDGVTGLFQSNAADGGTIVGGWTLAAGAPCAIAQGGVPVAGVTTDLYGVARSGTTPTVGAAELTGMCSGP